MLAPPPIILDSAAIDDPMNVSSSHLACSYYDRRGSSLTPRQMSDFQQRPPRGRIRSASVFDEGLQNEASKQRRPSRAYLLKQKATGEETIVTLMPIHGGPVSGAKTLHTQVPTFVSSARPVNQPRYNITRQQSLCPTPPVMFDILSSGKKSRSTSMDDQDVCYKSIKLKGEERKNNDLTPSAEALEAQRLRKMYNQFRRQASGASTDSYSGIRDPQNQRLDNWLEELEAKQRSDKNRLRCSSVKRSTLGVSSPTRRQSTCISSNANLAVTTNAHAPRIERAHSTANQVSVYKEERDLLNIISRAQSQQDKIESGFLMPEPNPRRIQRAQSHCPGADIRSLQQVAARSNRESRSSLNKSPNKLYPTTSRRCSEAVAAYAATGDLEMARNFLLEARERSVNKSINEDDDEDTMRHDPPSEKERKNMVIVVSCVGLLITVLAATMVGITLGLSHLLEEPDIFSGRNHSVQRQLNMSNNSTSWLESANILNGNRPNIVPDSSNNRRIKSGGGNLLGSEELGKEQLRKATDILRISTLPGFNNNGPLDKSKSTTKSLLGLSPSVSSSSDVVPNKKVSSNNPLPPPLANNNSIINSYT